MFKFDFDLNDEELDNEGQGGNAPNTSDIQLNSSLESAKQIIEVPFTEIPLTQLLDALPMLVSYSPLNIPLSSAERTGSVTLARRELFDARFQLISSREEDSKDQTQALEFLDAPSDLVPGIYEGGLKTWECSLDLVAYLDSTENRHVQGNRVLEIGCGTAVPTLYLLQQLFSATPSTSDTSGRGKETHIHVQDYNVSVLELVTFPNIILAWYMSPASANYRSSLPESSLSDDEYPPADPSIPSDLLLPPSLKSAFQASLAENNIQLRFFSGSWEGFNPYLTGGPYNLVLTSETIYKSDGLSPLIKLMKAACGCHTQSEGDLDELVLRKLSVQSDNHPYLCLVAAKVLYFGVGGSVSGFVHAIEGSRVEGMGKVETVWEKRVGIGRSIMRVYWA